MSASERPPVTPTHEWVILARDASFVPQAQVEHFTSSTFTLRHLGVGAFMVTVPLDSAAAQVLLSPRAGIIVRCDGQIVFSGPGRARLRTNHAGLQDLEFSGVDDNFWLAARQAHPEPTNETPPYDTDTYDIRSGVCSTVLAEYVDANLGPAAIERRRLPSVTLATDPIVGSVVNARGRWQPLLDLMKPLALASSPQIGFRLKQQDAGLVFTTFQPTDLSASVVFQIATGTLGDYAYERTGAQANYLYAGGIGGATARLIVEGEDGDDINEWGLVEGFLDRRDIDTAGELEEAITAELLQRAGTFRTDLTVIDTAGVAWLSDYDVGDRVSVIVEGVTLTELVRELTVELGPNGDTEKVTPSVSSASKRATVHERALFSLVRELQTRIANLERNQ